MKEQIETKHQIWLRFFTGQHGRIKINYNYPCSPGQYFNDLGQLGQDNHRNIFL